MKKLFITTILCGVCLIVVFMLLPTDWLVKIMTRHDEDIYINTIEKNNIIAEISKLRELFLDGKKVIESDEHGQTDKQQTKNVTYLNAEPKKKPSEQKRVIKSDGKLTKTDKLQQKRVTDLYSELKTQPSERPIKSDDKLSKADQSFQKGIKYPETEISLNNANTKGKDKDEPKGPKQYLIYQCDGKSNCGGWADREKGIVSVYILALATNRQFGLNITSPCSVNMFLVPNQVDWIIKESSIRGLSSGFIKAMDGNKKLRNFANWKIEEWSSIGVIFIQSNMYHARSVLAHKTLSKGLPSWVTSDKVHVFRNAWSRLMKYSPHFEEHMDNFMSLAGGARLVCGHIRMRRNPTMPQDAKALNSLSTLPTLWKFLQSHVTNGSRVFIATDSTEVRRLAGEVFKGKQLDTGGKIVHIDRQRGVDEACDGFEMAILDQAILSQCTVLVSSDSGFGIFAATMSYSVKDLFIFKNGSISRRNLDW